MKRKASFKNTSRENSIPKETIVRDTRFGIRRLPKSDEHPQTYSYMNPGRGPNGEHQN